VVTDPPDITAVLSATNPALVIPMSALADTGLSVVVSISLPDPVFFAIFNNTEKAIAENTRTTNDRRLLVKPKLPIPWDFKNGPLTK
jgi:hypothetical protein